jgi:hypothetical protein
MADEWSGVSDPGRSRQTPSRARRGS